MRWGDTCNLLKKTESVDTIGGITYTTTNTTVYCNIKPVKYNEFYQAATANLKPEIVVVVRKTDYNMQELVKINNITYRIIRIFEKGENVELTLTSEILR